MRQPLKIDQLPPETRDEIQKLRALGKTWTEIEELSKKFVEWDKLDIAVASLFPNQRLPHTNLQRWYDLRVQQVIAETQARGQIAHELAEALASRGFGDLPGSVLNALGEEVFALTEAADTHSKDKLRAALLELGRLLAYEKRTEVQKQRADVETKKINLLEEELKTKRKSLEKATEQAAAKIGKGQSLTLDDINSVRERTFGLPPLAAGHPA